LLLLSSDQGGKNGLVALNKMSFSAQKRRISDNMKCHGRGAACVILATIGTVDSLEIEYA
jgi:hypothetical protein